MDSVELRKTGASKADLDQVLDKEFKTFTDDQEQVVPTVEKFFKDYEELYWIIPEQGDVESHQYLVEKSSEVYKNTELQQEIDLLLQEISDLREELLTANKLILELQTT